MFSTRIKIITGYAVLAIVLVAATWITYDNTRSLTAVNRASEDMMKRRDMVDSLVCSMLETANAERSILLGDTDEWPRFDRALSMSADKLGKLRPMLDDTLKRQRLDSLAMLLRAKRENTQLVMAELGKDRRDIYYNNKVKALRSGRDSVVIHPRTEARSEQHETVYEIVKSRRGFFRRLGDAFRRQHADTVSTTHIAHQPSTDTSSQRLNIADSVANALNEIRSEEQRATNRQHDIINNRNNRLQHVSILLARRTGQLLEDIQSDERHAMQHAVDRAMKSRRLMIMRIGSIGLLAILSAAILVAYILRDIRRQRRDHERIIEAKAETERIMQQRERLLLTITHDIKAPAASIAGFIDLLGEYVDRPKAVGYLQNIAGSARHLLQLVSALLDYHQLESGKTETHMSSFAPAALVEDCVAQMQPQAMEKRLTLKADVRVARTMMCRSDAFRIKQAANNLISNAIKYTDNGEVTVAVAKSGNRLLISVADTGCGMTQEEQGRVFNAFTRLGNANGREGVGLGLSITREIVQMLGGTVGVASRKGVGSKFTVNIPVDMVEADGADNAKSQETHTAQTAGPMATGSLSVLIVDDDRLQLQLLKEMLVKIGGIKFSITTTMHAADAIDTARRTAPQLVFTDIEMPEMNGGEIMRRIRGNTGENAPAPKFIAMTAHEPSIMPQLRKEGFDACLFKPFDVQALAATITQLTRGGGLRPPQRPNGTTIHTSNANNQPSTANGSPQSGLHQPTAAEAGDLRHGLSRVLSQFADGDPEAERQIMDDIRRSIAEYLELLRDANDTERVARAAHKAMPLLEMLQPGKNGWLAAITPEHIAETGAEERLALAERLKEKLRQIDDDSE